MKELSEALMKNYTYIYRCVLGKEPSISDRSISGFLKKLSARVDVRSLGEWFAWYYVTFQFASLYDRSKMSRAKARFAISWIFGDKAIERWFEKKDSWKYWTDMFISELSLNRDVFFESADIKDLWESERLRYKNTELGYEHCQDYASYSDRSAACMTCKFRKLCKG